ncbi:MAG TPA: hypothetical protein VEH79_02530 [Gaiellaceae bacterium]|nr:hypothetical protein [Gaiellaceae bacterium]
MGLRERLARLLGFRKLTPEEMAQLAASKRIREHMTDDRMSQKSSWGAGQVYRSGESRSERDQRR